MDRIKSVLTGHGKTEDVTPESQAAASGKPHPIYDEMTGHNPEQGSLLSTSAPLAPKSDHVGTDGPMGGPAGSMAPVLATNTTTETHHHTSAAPIIDPTVTSDSRLESATAPATENVGADGPIGGPAGAVAPVSQSKHHESSTAPGVAAASVPLAASEQQKGRATEPLSSSTHTAADPAAPLRAVPATTESTSTPSTAIAGIPAPGVHEEGSVHTGISNASIKSGVIGFGPSEGQEHAALPTNHPVEKGLHSTQVVGGGDLTSSEAAATEKGAPHDTSIAGTSTDQPLDKSLHHDTLAADTDRSFPLAGGIATKRTDESVVHEPSAPTTAAVASQTPAATATHEPVVTERESSKAEKERSIPVIGGLLAKLSSKDKDKEHAKEKERTPTLPTATTAAEPALATTHIDHTSTPIAPVAGGLATKHDEPTVTHTPTAAADPVPVAHDSSAEHKERSIPVIGGLLAKISSKDKGKETTPTHADRSVTESEPASKHAGTSETHKPIPVIGGLMNKVKSDKKEETPAHQYPIVSAAEPQTHNPIVTSEPITTSETAHKKTEGDTHKSSIPVIGALTSSHKSDEKEHTSAHQEKAAVTPVLVTKADEDADRRRPIPVIGGLLAKLTGGDKERELATTHEKSISGREPGTRDWEADDHKEAIAGATAAATAAGIASTSTSAHHTENRGIAGHGFDTQPTSTTTKTTSNTTTSHTPSFNPVASTVPSTTDTTHTQRTSHGLNPTALAAATTAATAAPTSSSTHAPATSERHIPGEFPAASPGVESRTFLDYRPSITETPQTPIASNLATHELRHTGSLNQPASKSAEPTAEHHLARDTVIAGGFIGGAAALSHEASKKHESLPAERQPLQETNPYSSHALDPRVLGTSAPIAAPVTEFQPASDLHAHGHAQTSNPAGTASVTESAPTHQATTIDEPRHHDRDLTAIAAASTAALSIVHEPTLAHTDTASTLGAILPLEVPSEPEPSRSSITAPSHSTSTALPIATSATVASKPHATGTDTFHGAPGAPAPVAAAKSFVNTPLSNVEHASVNTPTVPTTAPHETSQKQSDHHVARDATVTGVGLAAAAAAYDKGHHDKQESAAPVTSTSAPHESSTEAISEPKVLHEPTIAPHHAVGSITEEPASKTIGPHSSNIANVLDPRVQPDPSKQSTSGPHSSNLLNKLDPRVDAETGQKKNKEEEHHGRDAAIVGGAGLASLGVYEATKSHNEHPTSHPETSLAGQTHEPVVPQHTTIDSLTGLGSTTGVAAPLDASEHSAAFPVTRETAPTHTSGGLAVTRASEPSAHQRYDSIIDPHAKNTHDKRDAVLAGAGAAAVGGTAYEHHQHEEAERERLRLDKEQQERAAREAHEREKEVAKEEKEHEKAAAAAEKAEKRHEKEVAKEEKKHEKELLAAAAAEEKHQKEIAKEAEKHQKEVAKREKEEEKGEKKSGLLGFLHRDKSKKEKHTEEESANHKGELAAAGAAGAVGAGAIAAHEHDTHDEHDPNSSRWKGKTLLHKDPPAGHPAHDAMHQPHESTGKREHIGVDGPIGHPDLISGDRETAKNTFGAHGIEPSKSEIVIEPHTGLPMNIGKYGLGTGGTDGTPAISGHHVVEGAGPGAGPLANPAAMESDYVPPTLDASGAPKHTIPAAHKATLVSHEPAPTTTEMDTGIIKHTPEVAGHHEPHAIATSGTEASKAHHATSAPGPVI